MYTAANKGNGTAQEKGIRPTQCVLYPLKEIVPLENSLHEQQLLPKDEMNQQYYCCLTEKSSAYPEHGRES